MDAREIAQALARQAETVCRHLLPAGKVHGNYFKVGSISNESGQSLVVNLAGDKTGGWIDYANKDEHGDLLHLWARSKGISIGDALREARAYLGIAKPTFAVGKKRRTYTRPEKPQPKETKPAGRGTEVNAYLRGERALTDNTINVFQIRQADVYRGVKKDGSRYEMAGPWILLPFLRPREEDSQKLELINLKHLHVNRRKDPATGKVKKVQVQSINPRPGLFGWHTIPSDATEVAITEGEIDAMTVFQWGMPALSMPAGAGGGDKLLWIDEDWDLLDRFSTIYLVMDQDEEGQASIPEIASRLGLHRCRIVKLPYKDPNECLAKHAIQWEPGTETPGAYDFFAQANYLEPAELRSAADFVDEVVEHFHPTSAEVRGIPLPWNRGKNIAFRFGELTLLTGINSHGKSSLLNQVVAHIIDQGFSACVGSFEQRAHHTLACLVQQISFSRQPSEEMIRAVHDWFLNRLWMYDVKGRVDRQRLLDVMGYARRRYGVRFFVVDSLMKLGIGEDDYKAQFEFIETLTDWVETYTCHVVLVIHPTKPKDESKPVGKLAMKGSGGMSDLGHTTLEVWRNKPKEKKLQDIADDKDKGGRQKAAAEVDQEAKPDTLLICDKQRATGWEGRIPLWFDPESRSWRDSQGGMAPTFNTAPQPYKPEQEVIPI